MRYSSIRSMDVSNGEGVGVSLFVQGCDNHCKNCFNPETWDFNGGEMWTGDIQSEFLELVNRPYITRVSILGGEPLAVENLTGVLSIVKSISKLNLELIKEGKPTKKIWLYTGYKFPDMLAMKGKGFEEYLEQTLISHTRYEIIDNLDVLVDGPYIDDQRDLTLKWKGSKNQRVIDVQRTLATGGKNIIIYGE